MLKVPLTSSFGLREDAAALIASYGSRFDAEVLGATRDLFAGAWNQALPPAGSRQDDLPYGGDPRQRFDLFLPGTTGEAIVIFVPGGGFTGGDKSGYAHIGAWFCRRGFLAATVNYRLAPAAPWPAGAQDVSTAIEVLARKGLEVGADPTKIFVVGQSAGATHCCAALLDERFRPDCVSSIRHGILLSGIYNVDESSTHPGVRAYFGDDHSLYRDRSPVNFISDGAIPVELGIAEYDLPFVVASGFNLALALTLRNNKSPPLVWMRGHNHVSAVLALGTPEDMLGEAMAGAFEESVRQSPAAG